MQDTLRIPKIEYAKFQPSEVETITGVSTALLRDWRRRRIIHEKVDKGADGLFALHSVAEILLLRILSEIGIGPKTIFGWTSGIATRVVQAIGENPNAYSTSGDFEIAQKIARGEMFESETGSAATTAPAHPPLQPFTIITPGHVQPAKDAAVALGSNPVVTVVSHEQVAALILERAGKQLAHIRWLEVVG